MAKFLPLILPVLLGLIDSFSGQLTTYVAAHPSVAVWVGLLSTVVAALTRSVLPGAK